MSGVKERAQELLAARREVVTGLESAHSRLAEAQEGVRSAEGAVAGAWKSAVDAGWTAAELRKLGFLAPPARWGGRQEARGAAVVGLRSTTRGRLASALAAPAWDGLIRSPRPTADRVYRVTRGLPHVLGVAPEPRGGRHMGGGSLGVTRLLE